MKAIAFTFDDDVLSHHEVVAPMFEKYGLSCTFFINGGHLNLWKGMLDYKMPDMEDAQILDLYKRGFEIGNHTFEHIHIGASTLDSIRMNLRSTEDKVALLGIDIAPVIAYPGYVIPRSFPGARDKYQEIIDIFSECGYKLGRAGYFDEGIGHNYELDNNPQKWSRDDTYYYTPKKTNPYLVKCCGLFCDNFTFDLFKDSVEKAPENSYCVFTGHVFSKGHEVEKLEKICKFCCDNNLKTLHFSKLPI